MNRSPLAHEIPPAQMEVHCVANVAAVAGESPVWSVAERCLYFVDHQGRKIHRFHPDVARLDTYNLPGVVTSLAPRSQGGLIVTIDRLFALFDPSSGSLVTLAEVDAGLPDNRFNDGKCDRSGRFWAGTMGNKAWNSPCGTLFRLAAGLPEPMIENVRCSNGLAWSPDNATFYYAESFAHTIHAYDFNSRSGAISNRRVFATIDPASGAFPDGLTVDTEGGVWNAQPVFGRIVRYSPDGTIERIIEMPVSRCTSCIFGGDDLATLYVTSARETLTPVEIAQEPFAGGLFAFRPGFRGLPETPFAG